MQITKKIHFTILIVLCVLINLTIVCGTIYLFNIYNNYCIVNFNSNGGTIIKSQVIRKGTTIELPEEPKKMGFLFIGWIYNGKIINEPIPIDKNTILVAKWETYKIDTIETSMSMESDKNNEY